MGREREPDLTGKRDELFRLVAKGAFKPLARFGGEMAGRGFVQVVGMLLRGMVQEANLSD